AEGPPSGAPPAGDKADPDKKAPAGDPKKADPDKKTPPDARGELEKVTDRLFAFQQLLAGRVRVLDEREAKTKELLAALDELDKRSASYAKALAGARLLGLKLNATAVDLKKRLGKGELAGDAIPEGVTSALRLEQRAKLDATAAAILDARNH